MRPLHVIRPSRDLAHLARGAIGRLPRLIQHLFRGLGATEETGADLLSYLAFDGEYTSQLLELGYADVMAQRSAIGDFLRAR
jgi:NTE family protein